MPTQTTYTIKTTGLPIAAYDYDYLQDGINVWPLCDDGITRQPVPVTVPYTQFKGIQRHEVRLPAGWIQQTASDPTDPQPARPAVLSQNTTPSGKIRAVRFDLHRAEGPSAECIRVTCNTWEESDSILQTWARTAPKPGNGYDKTDFTVTYADGESYTGTYYLKNHDTHHTGQLARHIREFMTFYAGLRCPSHMTRKAYQELMDQYGPAEQENARAFLDGYELGPETDSAPIDREPEPQPAQEEEPTPTKGLGDIIGNLKLNI